MEAARNGLTTTTGKRKVRASNALQRKPFADRTNAPLSQSSPIPKPLNVRAAEDVAATGSVYTRRKFRSGRSASLVARLVENEVLFKYSTEEEEEEEEDYVVQVLDRASSEEEDAAGIKRCIATRLYREAESLFCRD